MTKTQILIVDDNDINKFILEVMIENFGCTTDSVNDGAKAIEILTKKEYDLIFMDCMMPHMDGFEAASIIRDEKSNVINHDTPIVAITGNIGNKERCFSVGMDDYLTKPIDKNNMLRLIQKWTTHKAYKIDSGEYQLKTFNQKDALSRLADDNDLLDKIILSFYEKAGEDIYKILETEDKDKLEFLLRKLKGSTDSIGADIFSDCIEKTISSVKSADDYVVKENVNRFPKLLQEFKEAVTKQQCL